MLYNLHANFDTHKLKLQGLSLPKPLFYDLKVAIKFWYIGSLRLPKCNMTRMLYDNLHANSDIQELKLQGLSLPKTLFYDFKVSLALVVSILVYEFE